jgi:N6-L-threonylcarbamoyladenine synthase
MKLLAIETSCDETALAYATMRGEQVKILDSTLYSQIETHAAYGGVVPEVAARKHLEKLMPMLSRFMRAKRIDAIAATVGPGLMPALRTGVEAGKTLALALNVPFIPVSHLEGHLYANWIRANGLFTSRRVPAFPVLGLLVSGGHTELILMKNHGEYELLGETLDDAAGEAFDKVAKMLGLPYPGGAALAHLAEGGDREAFRFPRALTEKGNLNFSFSGLKTSVLYTLRKHDARLEDHAFRSDIAASFEEAVIEALIMKLERAAKQVNPASIMISGGVSANTYLRSRIQTEFVDLPCFFPERRYSTDNAAMIAAAGLYRYAQGAVVSPLEVKANPHYSVFV